MRIGVVFKEGYRANSRRIGFYVEGEVCRTDERSILGKLISNDSCCAANYPPHQKKKGHSGLIISKDEETVLLSEIKQILKHVKKEMHNYKTNNS